jgi:uncharacterized protein YjbI with pentapeptide repeats
MFKFGGAWNKGTIAIKEAKCIVADGLYRYVVNEPNFETLIKNMAQYGGLFNTQYFEGYKINKLTNYNKPEDEPKKMFLINCAVFEKCDFTGAQILEYESRSGLFQNCNFTSSVFSKCRFHSTNFRYCDFTNADFHTYTDGSGALVSFYGCTFDNSKIRVTQNTGGDENYAFHNCSLKNADLRGCDFSINSVTIENCDTSGARFDKCKISDLKSDTLFRIKFLLKGGEITNNPSVADKYLSWVGQNINPFG